MAEARDGKPGGAQPTQPVVRWDESRAASSYANVCNVACTREEVTLLLGVQKGWDPERSELSVQLENRVVLSPWAAKRLAFLLGNVVRQYEGRFGELSLDTAPAQAPGAAAPPARRRSTA
jgi:hypothetical protein